MSPSYNQFGKERDDSVRRHLTGRGNTVRQLHRAGFYPNLDRGYKRTKKLSKKGKLRCVGLVQIGPYEEKLWSATPIAYPQHEAEIAEIEFSFFVNTMIPGEHLDKYRSDRVFTVNDTEFRWEHDTGSKTSLRQMLEQMLKYDDYPGDVLWTCPNTARLSTLKGTALNDRHWFALSEEAKADPHRPIWLNNQGKYTSLPRAGS